MKETNAYNVRLKLRLQREKRHFATVTSVIPATASAAVTPDVPGAPSDKATPANSTTPPAKATAAVNAQEEYGNVNQSSRPEAPITLLQLPSPSNNMLHNFYDRLETTIRGLESLGEDGYGNLLIPIILERLPPETRRHYAREHGTGSWTLSEHRTRDY
ncbi:hypothetical protein MAR_005373 [Mya arenaria]|uniref:Uncharacterized protein n=1 Tax=Mya arenaria TaxID=6604 RepID=A0ABY7EZC3_MYAAR|nr:hypothetical protein MAR_005373 [Mya arenaria]